MQQWSDIKFAVHSFSSFFFFKLKQPFQAAHLRVSEGEDMMGIWIYFRWKNSIKLSKFNASHKRLADLDHGSYRMIKSNLYS